MPRIAPDGYDIIVQLLNDAGPVHTNAGTAGTSGDFTDFGSPVSLAQGLFDNALYIPGTDLSPNIDGTGGGNDVLATPNISLSGWVFLRRPVTTNLEIFIKQYFLNGWTTPYITFGIQMDVTNNGWTLFLTTGGTYHTLILATGNNQSWHVIPQGRWCHIGGTWDGTNLTAYLNGYAAGTTTYTGTIDYNTLGNRGKWFTGGIPGYAAAAAPIIVQDIRVANITRPASYFANIYYNGFTP